MPGQKTYWHLLEKKRIPTEYEIVSSRLLYYPHKGFAVKTPIVEWYKKYQQQVQLTCQDWENFADPRQTTYTLYTEIQTKQETFVDGLFASMTKDAYQGQLSEDWKIFWPSVLSPLLYPLHGLQMIAAYLGSMVPSGRLSIVLALQSADEIRRIQRFAQQLSRSNLHQANQTNQRNQTNEANPGKQLWEKDPHWQPLRKMLEHLLVTFPWDEAFYALNCILKPAFDELFMKNLAERAHRNQDFLMGEVLQALYSDCLWHQQWSQVLVNLLENEGEDRGTINQEVMRGWSQKWMDPTQEALEALKGKIFSEG